eukprot:3628855-Rhodomonas_salina.1
MPNHTHQGRTSHCTKAEHRIGRAGGDKWGRVPRCSGSALVSQAALSFPTTVAANAYKDSVRALRLHQDVSSIMRLQHATEPETR